MIYKFLFGSQVYGTVTDKSDNDYAYLLTEGSVAPIDLSDDTTVYTLETFQQALNEHHLKAIEIYFSYKDLLDSLNISFIYNPDTLRRSVAKVVSNAHVKAKKKIRDGLQYTGLKSYWHCHRIVESAIVLATTGEYDPRVCDKNLYKEIVLDYLDYSETEQDQIFKELRLKFDERLNNNLTIFRKLCPKAQF